MGHTKNHVKLLGFRDAHIRGNDGYSFFRICLILGPVWGATVITSLFGAIPVIGEPFQTWLLGGPADNATLNRSLVFITCYLL